MIPILSGVDEWCGRPSKLIVFGPPGTGKTTAVLDRFIVPALSGGVEPEHVLACSFSRAAAGELRGRLALRLGLPEARLRLTCSTIHAEAMRRVKETIRPDLKLYDGVARRVMSKRGAATDEGPDRFGSGGGDGNELREAALAAWDYARGQMREGDSDFVRDCISRLCAAAMFKLGAGVQAVMDEIEAYEAEKREADAVDFTDLLRMALRLGPRHGLSVLIVDEAQDCSPLQYALIERWAERVPFVVWVGDADQCHPPGTAVTMAGGERKAIENVRVGDRVAYVGVDGYSYALGNKKFCRNGEQGALVKRVGSRLYSGDMLTFKVADRQLECTSDHRCVVRVAKDIGEKYCTYLMVKGDRARVGLARYRFPGKGMTGVVARAKAEGADAAYILDVFDTRQDAWVCEQAASYKFGIPQLTWGHAAWRGGGPLITKSALDAVYAEVPDTLSAAKKCLAHFGRSLKCPVWSKSIDPAMVPQNHRRYVTFACNVFPCVHEMTLENGSGYKTKWASVSLSKTYYSGVVHSLEVESRGHTQHGNLWPVYFANGVLTHNCVHEWMGAAPALFTARMRDHTPRRLAQSYRVPRGPHALAMSIIQRNADRVPVEYLPKGDEGVLSRGDWLDNAATVGGREDMTMFCLARSAWLAREFTQRLRGAGIPYACEIGGGSPWRSTKARHALYALMRLRAGHEVERQHLVAMLEACAVKGTGIFSAPKTKIIAEVETGPEMQGCPQAVDLRAVNEADWQDVHPSTLAALKNSVARYGPQILLYPPTVTVTSIHRSKGREADIVAVLDAMPSPVRQAYDRRDADAIASERRCLYVAATRTKRSLIVVPTRETYGEFVSDAWQEGEDLNVPF